MSYKAIIIDDEEMARNLLAGMIREFIPDIEVVGCCSDVAEGVKAIHKHKPDIVFLDIEMPTHTGLELLDFFNEEEIDFSIIFVTAYNQYAIQAIKLAAVDYILKPFEPEDISAAFQLFLKEKKQGNYKILQQNFRGDAPQKIALPSLTSVQFVELNQILYFQAEGAYTTVALRDGRTITVSKSLKLYENILQNSADFFRCHRSYIVNVRYIKEYVKGDGGYLLLEQNHQVSISTEKATELFKIIDALQA